MSIKKQYQTFIDEIIKGTPEIAAYKTAYPKATDESARVQCYRLLQNVTIASAIKEGAAKIRAIATQEAITELKEQIKADILTASQKREMLFKIVNGGHLNEKKRPVFNPQTKKFEIITVHEKSDDYAILKAIEVDNKMSGDNAPDKLQHTGSVIHNNYNLQPGNEPLPE